jgi:hypothetical protein
MNTSSTNQTSSDSDESELFDDEEVEEYDKRYFEYTKIDPESNERKSIASLKTLLEKEWKLASKVKNKIRTSDHMRYVNFPGNSEIRDNPFVMNRIDKMHRLHNDPKAAADVIGTLSIVVLVFFFDDFFIY